MKQNGRDRRRARQFHCWLTRRGKQLKDCHNRDKEGPAKGEGMFGIVSYHSDATYGS